MTCRRDRVCFLFLFGGLYVLLNVTVAVVAFGSLSIFSVTLFLVVCTLNIGISYGLTQWILSIFVSTKMPPRLERLEEHPRVAVLYVTCDDVIPQCLENLSRQSYPNYDVFVLDDSADDLYQLKVDHISKCHGYQVVRRNCRSGFKAGALNNWLLKYGSNYKYFTVLDADSLVQCDYLSRMLQYSEHPSNGDMALFQSKLVPWNHQDILARAVGNFFPISLQKADRLLNRYCYLPSWGHNNLYRTDVIAKIGFDEKYSSEDVAIGVDLASCGLGCCLVDIISYEKFPGTFDQYAQRNARWARQTLQLLLFRKSGKLPLTSWLHLLMVGYGYLVNVLFVVGSLLIVWGGSSRFSDFGTAISAVGQSRLLLALALLALYIGYVLLLDFPFALTCKVPIKKYFLSIGVRTLLSFYSMIPTCRGIFEAFQSPKARFEITEKRDYDVRGRFTGIRQLKWLIALVAILIGGLVRNPLPLLMNGFWIVPMVLSPAIIVRLNRRLRLHIKAVTQL